MIEISLPFPPSVNCLFAGKARRYPSPRYKKWRSNATWHIIMARRHCKALNSPMSGPLDVEIWLVPPDKRRRDVDNYSKALLDSLVDNKVIEDDSQIKQLKMCWAELGASMDGAIITIRKCETPQA